MDTGRIDERHLSHAYDPDLGTVPEFAHKFLKLSGNSEEIRAVDFIDLHSLRNGQAFVVGMDTGFVLHLDLILHRGNLGRLHYSPHEQDTCKHQAHGYSHGQVENHRQEECYEQYRNI